ncbi:hypothetical protein [Phytohabitans aurantiacus]|uniref:Uncharacterized protein n=1 Tax=Phytohabitans aurantiacus TaxID=3016789 RepID=A0ABQ5R5Y3_9ACTN|nr:hypothetical protein [Phytohabitans aurantiacus]GLI02192.1 hypothetical protein Pa4123_74700 [Phytohabitans aurantiacus]
MTARQWAQRLPIVVALLLGTIAVTGPADATPRHDTGQTASTVHAVLAAPLTPELRAKVGLLLVKRGGAAAAGAEVASATWAAAVSVAPPALWWVVRAAEGQQRPGLHRETFQGRAPPATR